MTDEKEIIHEYLLSRYREVIDHVELLNDSLKLKPCGSTRLAINQYNFLLDYLEHFISALDND